MKLHCKKCNGEFDETEIILDVIVGGGLTNAEIHIGCPLCSMDALKIIEIDLPDFIWED